MHKLKNTLLTLLLVCSQAPLAGDLITVRQMTLELATDIARSAVLACREAGYQVSAVVVDRSAVTQVVMRDVHASRFTIEIARDKANAVILSGADSGTFRANRADIKDEMNQVEGILMLTGGVAIRAAGSLLGAVGVSGAPGGEKDEACALKALESVAERLEFAD